MHKNFMQFLQRRGGGNDLLDDLEDEAQEDAAERGHERRGPVPLPPSPDHLHP